MKNSRTGKLYILADAWRGEVCVCGGGDPGQLGWHAGQPDSRHTAMQWEGSFRVRVKAEEAESRNLVDRKRKSRVSLSQDHEP